jgi:hypothetical protein
VGGELAVLPAIALVSNLAIVVFMLRRGVKTSHPSFLWLLFVVVFFSWIISDLALRLIGQTWQALPWFSLAYLFADVSPCIFVLFALSYTRGFHALERQHAWIVALLVLPQAVSWVRSTVAVLNYTPVTPMCAGDFGYCDFQDTSLVVLGQDWYFFGLSITLLLFVVGFLILLTPHKERRTPAYGREIRYILGGMALLLVVGLSTDIIMPLFIKPWPLPGLSSLAIVGMNFVIALGITRRGVLLFAPVTERIAGVEGSAGGFSVTPGRVYVMAPAKASAAFKSLVHEGMEGVYVCAASPAPEIVEAFKRIPVIVIERQGWGVREEGNIRYVPATNLRGLSDSILNYARTVKKGVIYLDQIDHIFDDGWITARSALEIGRELSGARPGGSRITWLYSIPREGDPVELNSLFELPIVKKAVVVHLFNKILEKCQMPPSEALRRIETLRGVDPFFESVELRGPDIALSANIGRQVDLLTTDVANKVRIFLKQFEGQMTPAGRSDFLRGLAALGFSPYSFIVRGGDAYLLNESTATRGRGYEILKELVRQGYLGLCISRTEPTKLAERYAFEPGTLVFWLTAERRGERDLKPAPEYLVNQVKSFVDAAQGKNGVILLDGLEFLITFAGDQFETYLKALRRIADLVAQSRTVFIVVYDAEVFLPERVALIRRSGFELLPATADATP